MVFLDPKTDVAFKKLFGDQAKSEIIISFLNNIMDKKDGSMIETVTIIDPFHLPDSAGKKQSIVDIKCVDQNGHTYIVEMQVVNERDYVERSQYYAAGAFYKQLEAKQKYGALRPVIFIGIVNYDLFPNHKKRYLSHKQIRDTKTHEHDLKHMEWYFIELTKFNKELNELKTVTDKWIYLLKEVENLETVPKELKTPEAIHFAMETLEQGAFTPAERDAYEREIDWYRRTLSQRDTAIEDALFRVAKSLIGDLSDKKVAEHTGLPIEKIKELKAELAEEAPKRNTRRKRK